MRSKIVIMKPTSSGVGLIGLDSLLDVYANTVAGDLVTVYPGAYNVGDNSILFNEGVNWKFIGRPTISSDSLNGTFRSELANKLKIHFDGDVNIVNTNGRQYEVFYTYITGYEEVVSGYVNFDGGFDLAGFCQNTISKSNQLNVYDIGGQEVIIEIPDANNSANCKVSAQIVSNGFNPGVIFDVNPNYSPTSVKVSAYNPTTKAVEVTYGFHITIKRIYSYDFYEI